MHKATQEEQILDYIVEFGSITPLEALRDLGVMRLASRISTLRKTYPIRVEMVGDTNRRGDRVHYARYSLSQEMIQKMRWEARKE